MAANILDRIIDAYCGKADAELADALQNPAADAAKLVQAVRTAAALPIHLASIPGLEEIAALEARLAPDTERVIANLKFTPDDCQTLANESARLTREGRDEDAASLRKRFVRLRMVVSGPDDPATAISVSALAQSFYRAEKFEQARRAYEEVVAMRTKALGLNHTDTALALSGLGRALEGLARFEQAAECHRRAISILEPVLSERHPDTAVSYRDLGCTLHALGDLAGARHFLERALTVAVDIDGPDDPLTAKVKVDLGSVLMAQGDLDTAEAFFQDALEVLENSLGPDASDVSWALSHLGSLHLLRGDYEQARDCFQRALATPAGDTYGDYLRQVALHNNLAATLEQLGDRDASRTELLHCLETAVTGLGDANPITQQLRRSMARFESVEAVPQLILQTVAFEGQSYPLFVTAA